MPQWVTQILNVCRKRLGHWKNSLIEIYNFKNQICLKFHSRPQSLVEVIVKNNEDKKNMIVNDLKKIINGEMPLVDNVPGDDWENASLVLPHSLEIPETPVFGPPP